MTYKELIEFLADNLTLETENGTVIKLVLCGNVISEVVL